jgi:hypothetical protein
MPPPDAPVTLDETLDAIAEALRALHRREQTGALAELRRLDVDRPVAPAFQAVLATCVPDHLFAPSGHLDDMTRRFAQVARFMALKPDGLSRKQLGTVLHAVGLPPTRLAMLLNAQGPTLDDLVRRVARRIALSDEPLAYRELASLILRADKPDKIDALRLKIARDYHRAARAPANTPA